MALVVVVMVFLIKVSDAVAVSLVEVVVVAVLSIFSVKFVSSTDTLQMFATFYALLTSYGISHILICAHIHHQNGVVERKHRHIVKLGLTLLHHASLLL